jgi:hypothetical protein
MFAKAGFNFTKTEGSGLNFISKALIAGKMTEKILALMKS